MSNPSKSAEAKFLLDGIEYNAPIGWEDITIIADYENDAIQPRLSIEEFEFTLEARKAINQWIALGLTGGVGIFEGMPFQLVLFNNTLIQQNFKAILDFTNDYTDLIQDGKLTVRLMKDKGLDNFFNQVEGTTYGYLFSIGAITIADFINQPYVVEKKFNLFEILMTSIVLYLMTKELAESIQRTADAIATVAALLTTSVFPLPVGSIAYAIAIAIINVVYTIVLVIAIISLTITLINTLVPPKRNHKVMTLRRLLEVVCNHFGYGFVAPTISELDHLNYLPSNPNLDEKTLFGFIQVTNGTPQGIPDTQDYGYNCSEMFELAKRLFNGKYAIIGNDVHLRPENDPFWIQQSNWQIPNVEIEQIQYNTDELKGDRLLTFEYDLNDEWTIDNSIGTAFEIRTTQINTLRKQAVLIKGLEEIRFNVALGSTKLSLNGIELLLKFVAQFIDTVTGVLGGGTNFAVQITSKVGILKQTENWHSLPKLLYTNGNIIPVNHRNLWNAQVLWVKYHIEKSFVANNFHGQKFVYNNVKVPFGFEDYNQLTTNPYFLFNGSQAKIIKFDWSFGEDFATISFYVRKPYTKNLKEIFITTP